MNSIATDFDYEEIVRQLIKKNIITEKLEDCRTVFDKERWTVFSSYCETKNEFELVQDINNEIKAVLTNKSKMRRRVNQQNFLLNQKLANLEQLHAEIKIKAQKQSEVFSENMEKVYEKLQILPYEFDNENVHQVIKHCKNSIDMCEQDITKTSKEFETLKSVMENFESSMDLPTLSAVTELIQKESLERYGDPIKIQYYLLKMRQNNEALFKKLQDFKVKYGI